MLNCLQKYTSIISFHQSHAVTLKGNKINIVGAFCGLCLCAGAESFLLFVAFSVSRAQGTFRCWGWRGSSAAGQTLCRWSARRKGRTVAAIQTFFTPNSSILEHFKNDFGLEVWWFHFLLDLNLDPDLLKCWKSYSASVFWVGIYVPLFSKSISGSGIPKKLKIWLRIRI